MSSADAMVKTRLLIISDTHADTHRDATFSEDGAFRLPLPSADVLLHSGDITMIGTMREYRQALETLKEIDAELKLVIAGNHDLSLHASYYLNGKDEKGGLYAKRWSGLRYRKEYVEQAHELWNGPEAKEAGVTYLTEGLHTFNLKNGAVFTIYASPWQPEFWNWAFNYPPNEDRWNPPELVTGENVIPAPPERDPHPIQMDTKVDLMMTHGPPHMHLDKCKSGHRAGCPHLLKALDRVRPRLHCFGHIHESWGAERITWQSGSSTSASGNSSQSNGIGETVEIIGGRNDGGMGVTSETENVIRPNDNEVVERRAAYVDISSASSNPLKFGEQTLLINSCVVDLDYDIVNAGWLVDLDLPAA